MKKIIFITIIVFMITDVYANIGIVRRPSEPFGNLVIYEKNTLKVVKETLVSEITSNQLINNVTVTYKIKNTGSKQFAGNLFFLSSYLKEDSFRLRVNGKPYPYKDIQDRKIMDKYIQEFYTRKHLVKRKNRLLRNRNRSSLIKRRRETGRLFSLAIDPGQTATVRIKFRQFHGFDRSKGGGTYASNSHFFNMFKKRGSGSYASYHYFLYPIYSFKEGVETLDIKVTYPKTITYPKYDETARVEKLDSNIPLKLEKDSAKQRVYTGTFDEVPADVWYFGLDYNSYNKWGFTLVPYFYYNYTRDTRNFAFSAAVDYIIKHEQVSVGGIYTLDKQVQLFQEVKFFPHGNPFYMAGCFDFRFAAGLVEQVKPDFNIGFKLSAGIRALLPLEIGYIAFPRLIKDRWEHSFMISVPLSF